MRVSMGGHLRGRRIGHVRMLLVALVTALSLAITPGLAASEPQPPLAHAAHSCSAGYKHAVTPGGHRCLRAGQYCSTKSGYQKVYKSNGYVCSGGRLKYR